MRTLVPNLLLVLLLLVPAHAEEDRATIGLVLGGGGALGFAHIGVLKVLEEMQVPVDYIGGTSMGAIVAAMYASGMSPEEIEQQFVSLNWWDVLKDKSPNQFLEYRRKVENKRYMGMEFGLRDNKMIFPPGMAYGQKLNNVISTFALNSIGIHDFDQLNIPYRAVATDLRSGKSVVLKYGNLSRAMRASMAVPGIFTPVLIDDMVLVDGGILNNIPVEVIKQMGADIIIAVDVGESAAAKSETSDFNALADVVSRTYTIVQRPDQERQLEMADLVIAPDLDGFSSTEFHKAADIIPCGYRTASQQRDELKTLSVGNDMFAAFLERQRKKNVQSITVTDIQITGNQRVPTRRIDESIHTTEGPFDLQTVLDDLNRIHGMGDFQTVSYQLEPDEPGYSLKYNTVEKFWGPNYLHFGVRIENASDSELLWSMLVNYNRTRINRLGGEIRLDLEGGGKIREMDLEWYQPISGSERVFIAPSVLLSSEVRDYYLGAVDYGELDPSYEPLNSLFGDDDIMTIDQNSALGRLDGGISLREYGEARIGITGGNIDSKITGSPFLEGKDNDSLVGVTTTLRLDQLDDPEFPTKGYRVELDGLFAFEEIGSSESFSRLELKAKLPLTLGRHTITPSFQAGSFLSTESDTLPTYTYFDLGGLNSFAGYAPYQLWGFYYGVGSLGYRYRIAKLSPTMGRGIYGLLRMDAGNTWFSEEYIKPDNINYGGVAGFAAETLIGTCTIAVGKAESLNPRFYFSFGNTF